MRRPLKSISYVVSAAVIATAGCAIFTPGPTPTPTPKVATVVSGPGPSGTPVAGATPIASGTAVPSPTYVPGSVKPTLEQEERIKQLETEIAGAARLDYSKGTLRFLYDATGADAFIKAFNLEGKLTPAQLAKMFDGDPKNGEFVNYYSLEEFCNTPNGTAARVDGPVRNIHFYIAGQDTANPCKGSSRNNVLMGPDDLEAIKTYSIGAMKTYAPPAQTITRLESILGKRV